MMTTMGRTTWSRRIAIGVIVCGLAIDVSAQVTFERLFHLFNFVALVVVAAYFVFSIEKSNALLAEKLTAIDSRLKTHANRHSHTGAASDIRELTKSVEGLVKATEYQQRDIERLIQQNGRADR